MFATQSDSKVTAYDQRGNVVSISDYTEKPSFKPKLQVAAEKRRRAKIVFAFLFVGAVAGFLYGYLSL